MTTLQHQPNTDQTVIVAGGTGNVGGFIVRSLLQRGVTVAVPSRSERRLQDLRAYLDPHVGAANLARLHTFVGTASDEEEGPRIAGEIVRQIGTPAAVIALMGSWRSSDAVFDATAEDLDYVLQHYLKAHFGVARTFLPLLNESGGTYVFVNGPLAFEVWPRTGLVSIATAAQHMLFKVLATEYEASPAHVVELVTYAFIRDRQTQPGSPIPGEAVGDFAAYLVSDGSVDRHGESVRLNSLEQLEKVGLAASRYDRAIAELDPQSQL